jgi:hypothetical protein
MSNEILVAGAVIGGVALGMREDVRKSVKKAAGVTSAALTAGKSRFTETEPSFVEATTVTNIPRQQATHTG